MTNERNQRTFGPRESVPEDAVGGAPPRSRRSRAASNRAAGRTELRRWSVAELIARALAGPPAGGVAR